MCWSCKSKVGIILVTATATAEGLLTENKRGPLEVGGVGLSGGGGLSCGVAVSWASRFMVRGWFAVVSSRNCAGISTWNALFCCIFIVTRMLPSKPGDFISRGVIRV